jgi:type VI secretion system Hcp family effector
MRIHNTIFAVILSAFLFQEAQAQHVYMKAYGSGSNLFTENAGMYLSDVKDVRLSSNLSLKDFSEVSAFSFDTEKDISDTGGSAATISYGPFKITKISDIASDKLFLAQCSNSIMTIELVTVVNVSGEYNVANKLILKNAVIKSISHQTTEECACREETISFDYGTIERYSYTISPSGTFTALPMIGWDRVANKRINP